MRVRGAMRHKVTVVVFIWAFASNDPECGRVHLSGSVCHALPGTGLWTHTAAVGFVAAVHRVVTSATGVDGGRLGAAAAPPGGAALRGRQRLGTRLYCGCGGAAGCGTPPHSPGQTRPTGRFIGGLSPGFCVVGVVVFVVVVLLCVCLFFFLSRVLVVPLSSPPPLSLSPSLFALSLSLFCSLSLLLHVSPTLSLLSHCGNLTVFFVFSRYYGTLYSTASRCVA